MPAILMSPASVSGTLRPYWIDPGGTRHELAVELSPFTFMSRGATGLGAADVQLDSDKLPASSGVAVRHARVQPRTMTIPLTISDVSLGDLAVRARAVRGWFNTGSESRRTPGIFGLILPDDSDHRLAAYYTGGLGGDMAQGGPIGMTQVVQLLAPDPYPTGPATVGYTWTQADIGVVTVGNNGDIDAYPVWTILGPANTIVLTLNDPTPHKVINLGANGGLTLAGGQTLTIDTRLPGEGVTQRQTVPILDNAGTNQRPHLTGLSEMFTLPPGVSHIELGMNGTDANTRISVAYYERFLGLLR